jgi:hypothetical protein
MSCDSAVDNVNGDQVSIPGRIPYALFAYKLWGTHASYSVRDRVILVPRMAKLNEREAKHISLPSVEI